MSNFTIRDSCRHLAVDLRIIDAEIEKAFGLSHLDYRGATDLYSQFYFSEPEVILHQKSISWVGLIDTIIYYSDISYGPTSIYDIEAAMEHVRLYSIFFPKSASLFLSKIIEFLDQNGYYIFVEIHSEYEDKDERVYYDIQGNNCLSISRYGILKYSHGELLEVTPVLGTWLDYDSKWPDGINKLSQKLEYQINNHSIKLPEAAVEWILQNIHKIKELELNMDNEIGEHQHTKSIESQSDDFSVVGVEVPDLEVRQSAFDNKDAETADDILTKEEIPDMMISVKSVNNDSLWKRFINIIIGKK